MFRPIFTRVYCGKKKIFLGSLRRVKVKATQLFLPKRRVNSNVIEIFKDIFHLFLHLSSHF
jgi:hypothetical protein